MSIEDAVASLITIFPTWDPEVLFLILDSNNNNVRLVLLVITHITPLIYKYFQLEQAIESVLSIMQESDKIIVPQNNGIDIMYFNCYHFIFTHIITCRLNCCWH